jgi:prepilin-type N-terminal cleavage/methylation domain-containing protein/prepilin-type processing-associated H-X9-DG protein
MKHSPKTGSSSSRHPRGFTLIELLVVIAVIAVLIGILLPALSKARRSGMTTKCASNMHQIVVALVAYTSDFKMRYPPNLDRINDPETGKLGMFWYDVPRLGKYMPQYDDTNISESNTKNKTVGGGAMICPEHLLPGRSYAMNYWASSATKYDSATQTFGSPGRNPLEAAEAERGRGFDGTLPGASKTMLLGEAWGLYFNEGSSASNPPKAWFAAADIGDLGKPGERFGGGAGITNPLAFAGQWTSQSSGAIEMLGLTRSTVLTYVPFYRHGNRTMPVHPDGRANFAKADGSVEIISQKDLVEVTTGKSTLKLVWSPKDYEIVANQATP